MTGKVQVNNRKKIHLPLAPRSFSQSSASGKGGCQTAAFRLFPQLMFCTGILSVNVPDIVACVDSDRNQYLIHAINVFPATNISFILSLSKNKVGNLFSAFE